MSHLFSDTIEKMQSADDEQGMFDAWNAAVASLGGDKRHYGCWNALKDGDHISGFLLTTNYSDAWQSDYYGGLIESDPILRHASGFPMPFDWSDCPINNAAEREFMHIAAEAEGLRHGFSAALPTGNGRHGAVSVANESRWDIGHHMPTIYALTSALHMGVQYLQRDRASNRFGLTTRERSVLGFLRDGDPKWVIAEKMNVSQSTVKRYTESIYEKMGTRSAIFSVSKAIFWGLLEPAGDADKTEHQPLVGIEELADWPIVERD